MRRVLPLLLLVIGCSSSESASEEPLDAATDDTATTADTGAAEDSAPMEDSAVDSESFDSPPSDSAPADAPGDVAAETPSETKSAGCVSGKELPEGNATITVNGVSRKYVLRKPTGYTKDKAWPLVMALHPNGGNATYFDATTGSRAMRPLVKDKAILVLPEARTGDWRTELAVDLQYFEALLTRLKTEMCIDTSRIFSMGFSGGGSYSGHLGCNRTDIRAIASGGAVIYFDKTKCVGKPAAWITIGDGESIPARIEFRDFWRTRNGCGTKTTVVPPAATCVAYDCPDPDKPVQFCSHAGDHEWPSFGATAAWGFFSKF